MRTLTNINTEKANEIFEEVYFNYDLRVTDNEDGTSTITFDSYVDAEKFIRFYLK